MVAIESLGVPFGYPVRQLGIVTMKKYIAVSAAAMVMALGSTANAAGFIALEGSDATSFHRDVGYSVQLFKYLKGSSSKSVLVYNPFGTINIDGTTSQTNTYVTSLAGVNFSDYSAIYVQPSGGCCALSQTVLNGFGAAINSFIAAGGNIAFGDYVGGSMDGVVIGGAAAPAGTIQGFGTNNGGVGGGPGCTDRETVTAAGIAKGFTQPDVLGCWSHQGYESAYWEGLGYLNLIASSTEYTYRGGSNKGSSFLAIGGTLGSGAVPESATWMMMIAGFGIAGMSLRYRRRRTSVSFG
jgi:hypothetical protein